MGGVERPQGEETIVDIVNNEGVSSDGGFDLDSLESDVERIQSEVQRSLDELKKSLPLQENIEINTPDSSELEGNNIQTKEYKNENPHNLESAISQGFTKEWVSNTIQDYEVLFEGNNIIIHGEKILEIDFKKGDTIRAKRPIEKKEGESQIDLIIEVHNGKDDINYITFERNTYDNKIIRFKDFKYEIDFEKY